MFVTRHNRQSLFFFQLDCVTELSLSRAALVDEKLCRNVDDGDLSSFLDEAGVITNCFRRAAEMTGAWGDADADDAKGSNEATLKIEAASFAYVMHAFCSRLFKGGCGGGAGELSMELFERFQRAKKAFLDDAQR